MNTGGIGTSQKQNLSAIQTQKLSMHQIQTLNFLAMSGSDLREEILKAVNENPALQIVKDPYKNQIKNHSSADSQNMLEQTESYAETLQEHLIGQLNLLSLNQDEHDLSLSLIYNLDKNGFYGSMIDPITFLDRSRIQQTPSLLKKCIERIQAMDPVGTCCKTPEESLYVQAKLKKGCPEIALFILEKPGRLELLNPPVKESLQKKLKEKLAELKKESFGAPLKLKDSDLTLENCQKAISFIKSLNPFPAANYGHDSSGANQNIPNIVLNIEEIDHPVRDDNPADGILYGNNQVSFQIKYASGLIPEIRINPDYEKYADKSNSENKLMIARGKEFIQSLEYCKNTIAEQGYAIASAQRQFLLKGPDYLVPLTRKQIAQACNIHESTVSRMCSKKNSKYIQCKWGIFPASYFFTSAIPTEKGENLSSSTVKNLISQILEQQSTRLSDSKLTQLLNERGIKIARRTVAKYRSQLNIENSYKR